MKQQRSTSIVHYYARGALTWASLKEASPLQPREIAALAYEAGWKDRSPLTVVAARLARGARWARFAPRSTSTTRRWARNS
jgi:hypothetical protein